MDTSQRYFKTIAEKKLHKNPKSFEKYLKNLYGDTAFEGKRVLDIGAGNGLHSFYAASRGAREVVSIDPESDGAQEGFLNDFSSNKQIFDFDSVSLFPGKLQDFEKNGEPFDLIISHYSVNHLDEEACVSLNKKESSREIYLNLFKRLHSLLKDHGEIIIVDCSDCNLFSMLAIKNPFAPTIEWEKHQAPEAWLNLLEKSGFKKRKLLWLPPYQLGNIGHFFLSNKLGGFLTHGHFAIFMKK